MRIAIPLFDGFTALDAVGPYEILRLLPEADVVFTAAADGPYTDGDGALSLVATAAFDDVTRADVLLVPGGPGTRRAVGDGALLDWIRRVDATTRWTTSVCTGSLLLGAAGVLDGLEATSHWLALAALDRFGARPTGRRVVEQGKVVTSAGVSSGIDMALWLAGEIAGEVAAQAIQLRIEYDPEPPWDVGSPVKAPAHVVDAAKGLGAAPAPAT